jgi:hypothetical protein
MRRRPTAICMPGVRSLTGLRWPRLPSSFVVGVLAHGAGVEHDDVRLRAVRDRGVARPSSRPAMRAESCTFIWQP